MNFESFDKNCVVSDGDDDNDDDVVVIGSVVMLVLFLENSFNSPTPILTTDKSSK